MIGANTWHSHVAMVMVQYVEWRWFNSLTHHLLKFLFDNVIFVSIVN